uniref:Uncharacterized protein n=1 Tax=Anguilla anguilla TaxID=7936 RepID=A0A0E9RD64_ANGAN
MLEHLIKVNPNKSDSSFITISKNNIKNHINMITITSTKVGMLRVWGSEGNQAAEKGSLVLF